MILYRVRTTTAQQEIIEAMKEEGLVSYQVSTRCLLKHTYSNEDKKLLSHIPIANLGLMLMSYNLENLKPYIDQLKEDRKFCKPPNEDIDQLSSIFKFSDLDSENYFDIF
jgi:DNA replication protein DnaD